MSENLRKMRSFFCPAKGPNPKKVKFTNTYIKKKSIKPTYCIEKVQVNILPDK